MNNFTFFRICLISALFVLVSSHSCLRCAKWDPITGDCAAAPRNEGVLFEEEAYLLGSGTGICQSPWVNPISSYYSNGASCPDYAECPDPMGTYSPGEVFTIMWWARNHAIADQNPDTIFLYLSPIETSNQQTDATMAVFQQQLICSAPYMSCGGLNGNTVNCSTQCTMPSNVSPGTYTMLWTWPWQGVEYTTCIDITITSNSGSVPPSTPVTTGKKVSSPATTGKSSSSSSSSPATTGNSKSTSGKSSTSTSGKSTTSRLTTSVKTSITSSTPISSTSSSSTDECVIGNMKCLSPSTYSTCSPTRTGASWSTSQSCQAGLTCTAIQGDFIQCQ